MKLLYQCNIKIQTGNAVYWNHIPSLNAWIYSTQNPKSMSIICKKGKTEKEPIINTGILKFSVGCTARTEPTTLIGTQVNVNPEQFIYNRGFALKLSEIFPIIYTPLEEA